MGPAEEQKLQRAILALKSGDKPAAKEIFSETLRENPLLEDAWVGLSFCAETIDQRKGCLKRALDINPNHAYARSALAQIEKAQQPINLSPTPAAQKALPDRTNKAWTGNQVFAAFLGIILFAVCMFTALAATLNQQQSQNRLVANTGKTQFVEFYADW
jgi:hypothetical protein